MTDRKKSLRLAMLQTVIVVLLVALIIGITWYLTRRQLLELDAELASLETRASEMSKKRDQLPLIAAALPELIEDSRVLSQLFPDNPGDKELVEFLATELKQAGVELVGWSLNEPRWLDIKPGGKKSKLEEDLDEDLVNNTRVTTFSMNIRGRFPALLRFLENIKHSGRFIRFSVVSTQGPEKEEIPDLLLWRLDGDMFYITERVGISERFAELEKTLADADVYRREFAEEAPPPETPGAAEEPAEDQGELDGEASAPTDQEPAAATAAAGTSTDESVASPVVSPEGGET